MASHRVLLSLSTVSARHCVSRSLVEVSCTGRRPPSLSPSIPRQSHQPYLNHSRFQSSTANSNDSPNKVYSFEDIKSLTASPSADRILIDVREPPELQASGRIPGAENLPITSSPDGLFLPAEDFEDKFGFPKPKASDEIIFYCKAGVRSRSAAGIARMAGWDKIGEYPGSWKEWEEKGGKIEGS